MRVKRIRTRKAVRRLEEAALRWLIRIAVFLTVCIAGGLALYGWLVWKYM